MVFFRLCCCCLASFQWSWLGREGFAICLHAGFVLRNPSVSVLLEWWQCFRSCFLGCVVCSWSCWSCSCFKVDQVYAVWRFAIAVSFKSCYLHFSHCGIPFWCGHDVLAWFHYFVWYPSSQRPCQWWSYFGFWWAMARQICLRSQAWKKWRRKKVW